jgi:hypothetical protein
MPTTNALDGRDLANALQLPTKPAKEFERGDVYVDGYGAGVVAFSRQAGPGQWELLDKYESGGTCNEDQMCEYIPAEWLQPGWGEAYLEIDY